MLVAREDEVDVEVSERQQDVGCVEHDVPLPPCARDPDQVMVDGEDLDVVRLVELLPDPRVAVASDAALVDVRFGRVDPHHGEAGCAQPLGALPIKRPLVARVRIAEQTPEVHVADVPAVVIAGDDDLRELDLPDPFGRLLVFPLVAVGRQVTGENDDVRIDALESREDVVERFRGQAERAAQVHVADLGDAERDLRKRDHGPPPVESPTIFRRRREWKAE